MMYTKFIISDFHLASRRNLYYNFSIGNFVSLFAGNIFRAERQPCDFYF